MYNVLVADDEMIMRTAMHEMIAWEKMDCQVGCYACNGAEAWEYLCNNIVDIAILDIRMPGISGLELCELIKQESKDVCIILLTAYSDYQFMRQALRHGGVFDYIIKSNFEIELPKAVARAIDTLSEKKISIPTFDDGILQPNACYSDTVNRTILFLRTSYAQPISLSDIAQQVFLNRQYLCRLYKKQTGSTIMQDLTRFRVYKAKQCLLSGKRIAGTAAECGFTNVAYFEQVFAKYETVTPREWQRQHMKADDS